MCDQTIEMEPLDAAHVFTSTCSTCSGMVLFSCGQPRFDNITDAWSRMRFSNTCHIAIAALFRTNQDAYPNFTLWTCRTMSILGPTVFEAFGNQTNPAQNTNSKKLHFSRCRWRTSTNTRFWHVWTIAIESLVNQTPFWSCPVVTHGNAISTSSSVYIPNIRQGRTVQARQRQGAKKTRTEYCRIRVPSKVVFQPSMSCSVCC